MQHGTWGNIYLLINTSYADWNIVLSVKGSKLFELKHLNLLGQILMVKLIPHLSIILLYQLYK